MNEYEKDLAEWMAKRPDRRVFGGHIRCTKCNQMKPRDCFSERRYGIDSWCKTCRSDYGRKRYAKSKVDH